MFLTGIWIRRVRCRASSRQCGNDAQDRSGCLTDSPWMRTNSSPYIPRWLCSGLARRHSWNWTSCACDHDHDWRADYLHETPHCPRHRAARSPSTHRPLLSPRQPSPYQIQQPKHTIIKQQSVRSKPSGWAWQWKQSRDVISCVITIKVMGNDEIYIYIYLII